ncbi:MAG: hypothetical protein K0M70_01320 [Arenimonas sp.]|uniref:DUF6116 family protein n=1 Tax=Arenimonas sp. TaxID=1872635 RepID=UPI0025C21963|nr:DUF6116 family protein [Arenimonas sp.]MBW8366488.1 hypothetical protein [Arenimonas sp.]
MINPVTGPLMAFASRLRFPTLFFITLGLWAVNMVVPDPIPLIDEIVMGLLTLMLATWKKRKQAPGEAARAGVTIDGESRRE